MNKQQKQALDALRKKMDEAGVSNLDELIEPGNSVNAEELQELMELVAKTAACTWCRCYKCDKIIREFEDTQITCDKSNLITCHQWYDGYRTAMIALSDERIKKLLIKAMST